MPRPSKIFVGYRALGFVCNHVPLSLRYIKGRNENLVVTAIGKAFHTYGCSRLNLLAVSGEHPEEISCITSDAYLVYTAVGNVIYGWMRGCELKCTLKGPDADVLLMLPFGEHLIAVYDNNSLILWDIKSAEITLEIPFGKGTNISAIVHPSTYLNKILLGCRSGKLELWNLKTNTLIYTFQGWISPVTVLEQAPAVDVVAIGLESGDIYIHNLKFDETIMKFSQDWGAITAISFRTDGQPIMASASPMGHIAVWDLDKKRLHSEIREAHRASVSGMAFLPNEPLLITSSSDNAIKMWIFDLPDDGARLLRIRDSHSSPPTKIQFYGSNGNNILSAGLDSTLRIFSTKADNLNKSLGQASFNRKAAKKKGVKHDPNKMMPVVDFVSEPTREKDWDNVAAIHRHSKIVTTWSFDRSCMGDHKPVHNRFKGLKHVEALCLTISSCGNFVLIGYNTGHLDKFNIQSGIYRGSFGDDTAHSKSVRGIALDGFNQIVISGGADKLLKFWKFKDHSLLYTMKMEQSIAKMILHRDSNMLSVALDDFSINVVDVDINAKKIVRQFEDIQGNISDMTFSPDSRWLIAASADSSIKTWDIPSGRLIDWFLVKPICVSLALSPTGEFLATAHAGSLGIFLWANSTLYANVTLHPLPDSYDPLNFDLPRNTLHRQEDAINEEEDMEFDLMVPEFKSPEQISDELVTLSSLPQSKWLNLLDLDIIKRRNKPKEPVKIPKNAPFFLPIVSGLNPTFLIDDNDKKENTSKILHAARHKSEFSILLEKADDFEKYKNVFEKMKTMSPSNIDVEIRCLSEENGGSVELMEKFLKMINAMIITKIDFEIVNSYSALFLQIHYDTVSKSESLCEELMEINESVKVWESLQEKMNYILCIGNYSMGAVF